MRLNMSILNRVSWCFLLAASFFLDSAVGQTAPSFTSQPANATASDGAGFSVNVQVVTSNLSSVTWKVNLGTRTINASASSTSQTNNLITASIAFGPVSLSDSGNFQVVATNAYGSTLASVRTLTVTPSAPAFTTQPASAGVSTGAGATFTVVASGTAPLTYQWSKDGVAISGATSATYTIASTQTVDAGSFTVVVTNSAGSATSKPLPSPSIPLRLRRRSLRSQQV
jgi:hypothetical protein